MHHKLLILAGGVASRMKKAAGNLTGPDDKLVQQANTLTQSMFGLGREKDDQSI